MPWVLPANDEEREQLMALLAEPDSPLDWSLPPTREASKE